MAGWNIKYWLAAALLCAIVWAGCECYVVYFTQAHVSGIVLLDGTPVPGVDVELLSLPRPGEYTWNLPSYQYKTRTGADGTYRLGGLKPNITYEVSVKKQGQWLGGLEATPAYWGSEERYVRSGFQHMELRFLRKSPGLPTY